MTLFWDDRDIRIKNTARHHMKSWYSERIFKKRYKDQTMDMELAISRMTSKDVRMYTCGVVTHVRGHDNHMELRIKVMSKHPPSHPTRSCSEAILRCSLNNVLIAALRNVWVMV